MSFEFKLNKTEIDKAIAAHVATLGINTVGKNVTVDFVATRKGNGGYSAVVHIADGVAGNTESSHVLDNATTAEANAARVAVIKQTGTDALGHAAENKEEIPNTPAQPNVKPESDPVAHEEVATPSDDDDALPPVTPETEGHASTESKKSLFD